MNRTSTQSFLLPFTSYATLLWFCKIADFTCACGIQYKLLNSVITTLLYDVFHKMIQWWIIYTGIFFWENQYFSQNEYFFSQHWPKCSHNLSQCIETLLGLVHLAFSWGNTPLETFFFPNLNLVYLFKFYTLINICCTPYLILRYCIKSDVNLKQYEDTFVPLS